MSAYDEPTSISGASNVDVKVKLSVLWAVTVLLYLYADVLSLFRPGQLEEMTGGRMGPVEVSQTTLLVAAAIVIVPALMTFLTLVVKATVARWANIVLGAVYTLVNITNLIGETWAYYLLFGAAEVVLSVLIVWYAWRWRPPHP